MLRLLCCLTIAFALGFPALYFANQGLAGWFLTLVRPSWTLPFVAFGPLWTIANGSAGLAASHALKSEKKSYASMTALALSMTVLALGSYTFFHAHLLRPSSALISLSALLACVSVVLGFRSRTAAGWWALPYFLWAAYLSSLVGAIDVLKANA